MIKSHIAGTDPVGIARTSPIANYHPAVSAVGTMPGAGSSYETWLAWYESICPGGEFNEGLARAEVETPR